MASLLVLLSLLSLLALVVPIPRSTVFPILTHAVAFSIPILFRQCSRRRQRRAASRATTGSGEYGTETTGLYGLDHAVLNARLKFPPDKMWMNMGYWRDATELPEACEALVERILQSAGLLNQMRENYELPGRKNSGLVKRVLLDLGFGCGEQTLYLMNRTFTGTVDTKGDRQENMPASLFQRYVGITLDKTQYEFANSRVTASRHHDGENGRCSNQTRPHGPETVQLFCGDAANPSSWSSELRQAIDIAFAQEKEQHGNHPINTERYVLALDTAYHFRPSRRDIFRYTHSVLHAHFLAFDIFLAAPSSRLRSVLNNLLLRLLTPSLSAPFSNFVTPTTYKSQLRDAGYAEENIMIEDITEHVFPGLADFLERKDQQLISFGLSGFSKWRISGWLFRWLSSGGILRAGIVVAKWAGKTQD
ncbi:hypothetical protein D8B26_002081 [Coccidioides posadasii str. Silveira]|uniref:uncharacterized protein n=1 Tax=Coccidioides posadasii (strain RMSCC 757 / Silveira) TaxID=443226 RepID=UPI001BEFA21A|nr:hypothetical protein D8B26_002081 [Coccidioides posadasii str. Silveira]